MDPEDPAHGQTDRQMQVRARRRPVLARQRVCRKNQRCASRVLPREPRGPPCPCPPSRGAAGKHGAARPLSSGPPLGPQRSPDCCLATHISLLTPHHSCSTMTAGFFLAPFSQPGRPLPKVTLFICSGAAPGGGRPRWGAGAGPGAGTVQQQVQHNSSPQDTAPQPGRARRPTHGSSLRHTLLLAPGLARVDLGLGRATLGELAGLGLSPHRRTGVLLVQRAFLALEDEFQPQAQQPQTQ